MGASFGFRQLKLCSAGNYFVAVFNKILNQLLDIQLLRPSVD